MFISFSLLSCNENYDLMKLCGCRTQFIVLPGELSEADRADWQEADGDWRRKKYHGERLNGRGRKGNRSGSVHAVR